MPIGRLYKLAPAAVIGVMLAGVINTGTLALLPIYFESFSIGGGGTVRGWAASSFNGLQGGCPTESSADW